MHGAPHVIRCRSTQQAGVQIACDDVASTVHQFLPFDDVREQGTRQAGAYTRPLLQFNVNTVVGYAG